MILIGYACAANNGEGNDVLGQGRGDEARGRSVRRSGTDGGPGDLYGGYPFVSINKLIKVYTLTFSLNFR